MSPKNRALPSRRAPTRPPQRWRANARGALLAVATVSCLLAASAESTAHEAPMRNDGGHGLMVGERWVMRHWAPFDEREAERALGLAPGHMVAFLHNDHHTIAQLARHRGIPFETLVQRLSAWTKDAPHADRAVIEQRIRLMLVSGHLPQHVFDHVFHGLAFTPQLLEATALSQRAFAARRADGDTYNAMIRAAGNDPRSVIDKIHPALDRNAEAGVAHGHTPRSQALRMAARQHRRVDCWFSRPAQGKDAAAPYNRKYLLHVVGHTATDVPTTRAEQRLEDRRIQRGLAGRPPSCWELPHAYTGDPGEPLTRRALRRLARIPAGFRGQAANDKARADTSASPAPAASAADEHAGH